MRDLEEKMGFDPSLESRPRQTSHRPPPKNAKGARDAPRGAPKAPAPDKSAAGRLQIGQMRQPSTTAGGERKAAVVAGKDTGTTANKVGAQGVGFDALEGGERPRRVTPAAVSGTVAEEGARDPRGGVGSSEGGNGAGLACWTVRACFAAVKNVAKDPQQETGILKRGNNEARPSLAVESGSLVADGTSRSPWRSLASLREGGGVAFASLAANTADGGENAEQSELFPDAIGLTRGQVVQCSASPESFPGVSGTTPCPAPQGGAQNAAHARKSQAFKKPALKPIPTPSFHGEQLHPTHPPHSTPTHPYHPIPFRHTPPLNSFPPFSFCLKGRS
jgi:hypothetical protein